jgi:transcriptional regulator with XRE-family HTH domain
MIMVKRKLSLEDVLNEYLATESKPNYEALKRWVKRFPEYKYELADFTANWSKAINASEPNTADAVDEETLMLRTMSIVGDRIHAMRSEKQHVKASLVDLTAEAKKKGLGINDLAKLSELSVPIIAKIARGFLAPLSIPKLAIERLAVALDRTVEDVVTFIQNSTMSAQGVRFKSQEQPELPLEKEDFFDAVRNDRELSEEQRKFWLEFEHNE